VRGVMSQSTHNPSLLLIDPTAETPRGLALGQSWAGFEPAPLGLWGGGHNIIAAAGIRIALRTPIIVMIVNSNATSNEPTA